MPQRGTLSTYDEKRGFTITRTIDAPRDEVWKAWTDPDHLQWFFNPATFPDTPAQLDLRVGGEWRQQMIIDDHTRYVTGGIYREIVPPERLVFAWGARGGWPELVAGRLDDAPLATVMLAAAGPSTEMRFTLQLPDHLDDERVREWLAMGIREGWAATLDRLVEACSRGGELRVPRG